MICNNCKAENSEDTKFCRNCGKPLELSTIDRYPQLKLKPTSVYKLEPFPAMHYGVLFMSLLLFLMSLVAYVDDKAGDAPWELPTISFIIFIIYFLIFRKQILPQKIHDVADYFQSTQNKYVFIIKDGKFGVYNRLKHIVQIPCQYTFLQWKINFKVLTATTPDGKTFDIDIKNNKLS